MNKFIEYWPVTYGLWWGSLIGMATSWPLNKEETSATQIAAIFVCIGVNISCMFCLFVAVLLCILHEIGLWSY